MNNPTGGIGNKVGYMIQIPRRAKRRIGYAVFQTVAYFLTVFVFRIETLFTFAVSKTINVLCGRKSWEIILLTYQNMFLREL